MDDSAAPHTPPLRASQRRQQFLEGAVEMLPLCLAVVPWGLLAGSMAIQSGLSVWQSVGMSAIVFAGAAQLVTLGLLVSGANVQTIVISVFLITSQHFIYALSLRGFVSRLQARYRLPIGFLLTDELFALSSTKDSKRGLSVSYLLGAGLTFYVGWVAFSLAGIVMAASIPDLDRYHLDFSIIATFATIVVPMVKDKSTLSGIAVSLLLSMLLAYGHVEGGIVIAGLCGMAFSVAMARMTQVRP
ncbi:branched-chain amino acid permease [Bordetella ansorpii]|uniref:Branched-chain amino acid permease n=2 Tax=Bordetella ansorpii TaxID=288768 RepID=A0A157SRL2_9BORD|nr:branched-chain amino acid permease [Bordetella ansorpii]